MIQETTNSYQLFLISQAVPEIRGADYTPMEFLKYMMDGLNSGNTKVFVDIDDTGKLNGFIVVSIAKSMERPELFIDLAKVDSKMNGLGLELQKKVEEWAKELKINRISTLITKNEKAFCKKYGFERSSSSV